MRKIILSLFLLSGFLQTWAQETYPVNGVYDDREGLYAFTNATIYQSADKIIKNATLLIRDGKIEQVGVSVKIPAGAVEFDIKGKYIYPSFIDVYSGYGMPEIKKSGWSPENPKAMISSKEGAYGWNEALKPEFRAHQSFIVDKKTAKTLRAAGFGSALSHHMDGISRGTSTFVSLAEDRENNVMLKEKVGHHLSFSKGTSKQSYPSSLMGLISLLRQTYIDADWYRNGGNKEETNLSLAAWNENMTLPQFFDASGYLNILRAQELAKEFKQKYVMKANGDSYKRINEIKATNSTLIVPLKFPKAYDLEDPFDAQAVTIAQMKHWELAPSNAAMLEAAGVSFALTPYGLEKPGVFMANLRKAIARGLSKAGALRALTSIPAKLAGVENLVGTLEKGKLANFIITSGPVFDKKTKIHHNWVQGKGYILKDLNSSELAGEYTLTIGKTTYILTAKGESDKPKMTIKVDTNDVKVHYSHNNGLINLRFTPDSKGTIRLSGTAEDKKWQGRAVLADGSWTNWTAIYSKAAAVKPEKEKEKEKKEDDLGAVPYPFVSYGFEKVPVAETVLIKNATVWTNEKEGKLEQTDVLIKDGKIAKVGKNLKQTDARVIDGTGKHLTAGIIDEHSHIAISRGVNEGTQASSAEVRIGDAINSEDVNIYRQLAGGVVAAHLLHGSANPIGGQSAIVKLRWGSTPEEMKIKDAPGSIKFALGENVKQSNWGEDYKVRFPQTRMGVEQVFMDHFTRAEAYDKAKKSGENFRRDLEMDALLEIIKRKRFITCHSYVQSEINMLMKVADNFDFRINTFTHILEGYKVADKMKAHGAGGSTFSDWWAYKFEVVDAIPYNAAIMNKAGILTAINSDDAEMGRRLNQEAAKAVMYGDMSEEDAFKLVSLNPAKLLHIEHRTGSIKVGKDADLVLWTDNPLSIYAKADYTFVDGRLLYSIDSDKKKRASMQKERARLTKKMLEAKKNGAPTEKPSWKKKHHYHCDDIHDEGSLHQQHHHHDHHGH